MDQKKQSTVQLILGWIGALFLMLILLFFTFEILIIPFGAVLSTITTWNIFLYLLAGIGLFILAFMATRPIGILFAKITSKLTNNSTVFPNIVLGGFIFLIVFWVYAMISSQIDFEWENYNYTIGNRVFSFLILLSFLKIPVIQKEEIKKK